MMSRMQKQDSEIFASSPLGENRLVEIRACGLSEGLLTLVTDEVLLLPRWEFKTKIVRDHRVATCDRRRSWRSVSLAPGAFSSGFGLTSPVYNIHQPDSIVCRLETS